MKILKYTLLAITLFLIGFITHKHFWSFSLSQIHSDDVVFFSRIMSGQFYSNVIFAFSLGMLPIVYAIIEKITKIKFISKGLVAIGLILGTGTLFWFLRLQMINSDLKTLSSFDFKDQIKPSYEINTFYFEYYLFAGFIIGAVLAVSIFKIKNKSLSV